MFYFFTTFRQPKVLKGINRPIASPHLDEKPNQKPHHAVQKSLCLNFNGDKIALTLYPLPEGEDYETVGGLLNVIYGSIPEVGDVAVLGPYEFRVLQRSRRAMELVQLRITTPAEREAPRGELSDEV